MLEKELEIAMHAAREAGTRIEHYVEEGFTVSYKGDNSHVTEADQASDRCISSILRKVFPEDGILTEETEESHKSPGRTNKERIWIVDPLDGTEDFTLGTGLYAVHIGLAIQGETILGVVYSPTHKVMYSAVKGQGAYANSERMHVGNTDNISEAALVVSRKTSRNGLGELVQRMPTKDKYISGSCGLKMCGIADPEKRTAVGERQYDVFFCKGDKEWDTCAPQIILEEAGGKVTDFLGNLLTYNKVDVYNRNGVLATNGKIHEQALAYLR